MAEKKKIPAVHDEPAFPGIVKHNTENAGFDADVAYDGEEGLEKVRANPPDAIVLDVMMPGKDGYQVCSELKADDRFADIPIILLTAVASHVTSTRYSHRDGMSTEADDYLAKPASAEQITESIKGLLDM